MSSTPVRFGIMGTGRITRRLIAEIQTTPQATVTAIGSRSVERAQWQADNFGVPHAVGGYDALIQRDDVDASGIVDLRGVLSRRRCAIPEAPRPGRRLVLGGIAKGHFELISA